MLPFLVCLAQFILVYCACEVVSTNIAMSLFGVIYQREVFAAVAVHYVAITLCWRWWSRYDVPEQREVGGSGSLRKEGQELERSLCLPAALNLLVRQ